MANAGINITGDGAINDITSVNGRTQEVAVLRLEAGVYELHGTLGLVPPPYGWGFAANPIDRIAVELTTAGDIIHIETRSEAGELVDIPSMLTLHVVVPDRDGGWQPAPEPSPQPFNETKYLQLRAVTDERILRLQDLIDIGEATSEMHQHVLDWKRFRVALNDVENQSTWPHDVTWPEKPE